VIAEFFKGLFRSRVESVRSKGKGKLYGASAKAKGKVAGKFNAVVDGAANKAKGAVLGKKGKKKKDKEKGMGLFGKKKKDAEPMQDVGGDEPMSTVAISLDQIGLSQSREVVGWLVAMNGELKGQDYRIFPGRNIVGTAADCEVVLTDPYLSSKHCAIRFEDGQYILVDLDSTNGTMVNGTRTSKIDLIDNDVVQLGKTELKFKSLY
jgi:hypothetical protein